ISGNRNKSVHEVNVNDILSLAHLIGRLPKQRALIGIQPQTIDWSESLSEPVMQALPEVYKAVLDTILLWDEATAC
ncbi:MAG: peptidase M52, partial [Gammaproteobacteria bacterium]